MKRERARRPSQTLASVAALVVLLAAISLSACEAVDVFPEYRGVDLLENRGITGASWTDAYQGGVTPAWDYIDFTLLTAAEYGTDTGLPEGAEVYRLEIPNLLTDGGFESSTLNNMPNEWSGGGTSPTDFQTENGTDMPDGQYVHVQTGPEEYGLTDLNNISDGFESNALYHFQLDFKRAAPDSVLLFDYGDGQPDGISYLTGTQWLIQPVVGQGTPVEHLPDNGQENLAVQSVFAASETSNNFFYIGAPSKTSAFQHGYVDNVRIGRYDIFPRMQITLSPAATGSTLELLPGTYVFSVYVKSETDAQVTPTVGNRFRAGQFSIGVNGTFETYSREAAGWGPDTWVQITRLVQITPAQIADGDDLIICLTPTSLDTPAVGSVLIAAPRLELKL